MPQETPVTPVSRGQELQDETNPNVVYHSTREWGATIDGWKAGITAEQLRSTEDGRLDIFDETEHTAPFLDGTDPVGDVGSEVASTSKEPTYAQQLEVRFSRCDAPTLRNVIERTSRTVLAMRVLGPCIPAADGCPTNTGKHHDYTLRKAA